MNNATIFGYGINCAIESCDWGNLNCKILRIKTENWSKQRFESVRCQRPQRDKESVEEQFAPFPYIPSSRGGEIILIGRPSSANVYGIPDYQSSIIVSFLLGWIKIVLRGWRAKSKKENLKSLLNFVVCGLIRFLSSKNKFFFHVLPDWVFLLDFSILLLFTVSMWENSWKNACWLFRRVWFIFTNEEQSCEAKKKLED